MKKNIWIDLDEVLSETVDFILKYHNFLLNWKPVERADITNYNIFEIKKFDINMEQASAYFRDAMIADSTKLDMMPVEWAFQCLQKYKKLWYKFTIITARDWIFLKEYTYKRVEKYYPDIFDNILFANHLTQNSIPKSQLCKQENISIMLEDNFHYSREMAENWIQSFLLEKPRNSHIKQEHNLIKKIQTWDEVKF